MTYINPEAFDSGLDYLDTNGVRVDICSAEPTSYAQATSTLSLGNKTGVNTGAATNGPVDGRCVVVPAITGGTVTANGTATHVALTDGSGVLLATKALTASQVVNTANPWSLTEWRVIFRSPT